MSIVIMINAADKPPATIGIEIIWSFKRYIYSAFFFNCSDDG